MKLLIKTTYILFFLVNTSQAQNKIPSLLSLSQLDSIMINFDQQGNYKEALQYAKYGAEKSKIDSGILSKSYAISINNIGLYLAHLKEYDKADSFLTQALNLSEKILGDKHHEYTTTLNNLAGLKFFRGKYREAEKLFSKVVQIDKEYPTDKYQYKYLSSLNNLAGLKQQLGKYGEAEKLFLEALQLEKELYGDSTSSYADVINNLAVLYSSTHQYEKAKLHYSSVLDFRCQTLGEEHHLSVQSMNNLAHLYLKEKNYNSAENLFKKAKKITLKILGENHIQYAMLLTGLAVIYDNRGEYEKSKACHETILKIRKKQGKHHPRYASALHNFAVFYTKIKDYKNSENLYQKSLKINQQSFGIDHIRSINTLNELSKVYVELDSLHLALYYCIRAIKHNCISPIPPSLNPLFSIEKNTSEYYKTTPLHIKLLFNLEYKNYQIAEGSIEALALIFRARYRNLKKKPDTPQELIRLEIEACFLTTKIALKINKLLQNTFEEDNDKLLSLKQNQWFVNLGIEAAILLKEHNQEINLFDYIEQNKSILLFNALKDKEAQKLINIPDSLREQELSFKYQKRALKKRMLSSVNEQDIIKEKSILDIQISHFLEVLKNQFPEYYHDRYNRNSVDLKNIQEKINSKTLIIEYYNADSATYLMDISKDTFHVNKITPVDQNTLPLKAQQLINTTSNYNYIRTYPKKAQKEYVEAAHWFYKNLVEPALKDHPDVDQLIIVPDYTLNYIPFEVLLTKEENPNNDYADMSYLLKKYSISYNYSATLFKENLDHPIQDSYQEMLAIAPSYNKTNVDLTAMRSPATLDTRDSLQNLRGALEEVNTLEKYFNGTFITGLEANEKYFKQHAGNYGIIHLAMHGLLDQEHPILSSLAFTEDQDSLEDNFLEAHEISGLELSANLVVLSACETGYGKFQEGEGVLSLARSFMYAGVPALVVSLWKVEDEATAALMKEFYLNLSDGDPKDIALQKAKLSYLEQHSDELNHPYYWSSFIQLGNTLPIQLEKKGHPWYFILGILVVIGLVARQGYLYLQKK